LKTVHILICNITEWEGIL